MSIIDFYSFIRNGSKHDNSNFSYHLYLFAYKINKKDPILLDRVNMSRINEAYKDWTLFNGG